MLVAAVSVSAAASSRCSVRCASLTVSEEEVFATFFAPVITIDPLRWMLTVAAGCGDGSGVPGSLNRCSKEAPMPFPAALLVDRTTKP